MAQWFNVINAPLQIENLNPIRQVEKEIQAPVCSEGLPLHYGLNLKRLRTPAEGDIRNVDCKVAQSELSVLGGPKNYHEESRRPLGHGHGNHLVTLTMASWKLLSVEQR